ncbi:MAG: hypothetical protein M3P48_07020 [Actinomycetota bacterium]|nr:hypothetical protein [Actinomycetota bacterium]
MDEQPRVAHPRRNLDAGRHRNRYDEREHDGGSQDHVADQVLLDVVHRDRDVERDVVGGRNRYRGAAAQSDTSLQRATGNRQRGLVREDCRDMSGDLVVSAVLLTSRHDQ